MGVIFSSSEPAPPRRAHAAFRQLEQDPLSRALEIARSLHSVSTATEHQRLGRIDQQGGELAPLSRAQQNEARPLENPDVASCSRQTMGRRTRTSMAHAKGAMENGRGGSLARYQFDDYLPQPVDEEQQYEEDDHDPRQFLAQQDAEERRLCLIVEAEAEQLFRRQVAERMAREEDETQMYGRPLSPNSPHSPRAKKRTRAVNSNFHPRSTFDSDSEEGSVHLTPSPPKKRRYRQKPSLIRPLPFDPTPAPPPSPPFDFSAAVAAAEETYERTLRELERTFQAGLTAAQQQKEQAIEVAQRRALEEKADAATELEDGEDKAETGSTFEEEADDARPGEEKYDY